MHDLGSLLGRWHEWRAGYSHERKLRRIALPPTEEDDDERLERMLMANLEEEIERLPLDLRLAIHHIARAEALGVEVMHNPRLPKGERLDTLVGAAKRRLYSRLVFLGLI